MPRRVGVLLCAGLFGCRGRSPEGCTSSVRDSAGVTIVQSGSAAWGNTSPWSVDTTAILAIGTEEGEDPYLLSRVTGAVRRDDGVIIVAEASARELRLFDAEGRYLSTHGRRGPGPGEFNRIERIVRCGTDELWVDTGSRISIWGMDMQYRREFATPDSPMWPLICFDGAGTVVMQDRNDIEDTEFNVISTDTLILMVVDSVGAGRRELFMIPLWSRVAVRDGRNVMSMLHPLTPVTTLSGTGKTLLISRGEELRIDGYDMAGSWVRSYRGPAEDLALTDKVRDDYRTGPLTGADSMWRRLLDVAGNPMPDRIPAISELLVDPDGNIWARRFVLPGRTGHRWGVFNPDGGFRGHLTLPSGLHVMDIGREHVLGLGHDSLGVAQVRLHRLRR